MNKVPQHDIALAQQLLNEGENVGKPPLHIDGVAGNQTLARAMDAVGHAGWPADRILTLFLQTACLARHIDPGPADGLWGQKTAWAVRELDNRLNHTPMPERPPEVGTPERPRCWSPSTRQMIGAYGPPGESELIRVEWPYPLVLDWDTATSLNSFNIHADAAESALAAGQDILAHYGPEQIVALGLNRWGGCYDKRLKRGGSDWSTHSWGGSIDWWADANQMKWNHTRARFAQPEYKAFLDIWESHGWISLGRCFDFDWMHIQRNPQ